MDNPKEYISRIDEELKGLNKKFVEDQAVFTNELATYIEQLNKKKVGKMNNNSDEKQKYKKKVPKEINIIWVNY